MSESNPNRKPTILIVDDDDIFVELLTDELSAHFVVEWAREGRIALESVRRETPDAIFLDQCLPDARGVTLIDGFRKAGCDAPVVMLTATQDVHVAAAAMRAGAIDFIVKDANDSFYDAIVPIAIRAVDKWNNFKELEYLREQEDEQIRQTKQLNEKLRAKNDQLKNANREIEASQVQLRNKNRRLSELYETAHRFVDNVSHEMRTPLTVIKEFVSLVVDGLAGEVNEQQTEYLTIAMAKTNDLARMVDDMLDISKIEAGLLRVERRRCRFGDIIEDVRRVLEQKAVSCRIELKIEEQENLPELFCDKEKAGRVLINLVINATKFSDEGTTVRVYAERAKDPTEVTIGVEDEGPGIAAANLKVIFDRFKQVGEAKRSSTKGFGLGLNIVRELVNLNMGEVSVESEPGRGSIFSFTLPVFDRARLLERFLDRRDTFDHHGSKFTLIRVFAVNQTSAIGSSIQNFVGHHLMAFDMLLGRPEQDDVILLAITDDPDAMAKRLLLKNRDELRMSPGSTVDLSFEVLHVWEADAPRDKIMGSFVALFENRAAEKTSAS